MTEQLGLLIVLVAAFVSSVFIAAAETALLRVSLVRARSLADEGDNRARRLVHLLERLPRVLSAILLAALLAQIGAATVVGVLATRVFGSLGVTIASVALTVALFIYAEAIPKTFAVRHTDRVALALARPIALLEGLLRPIVSLLVWLADLQMPGKGITTSPTVTEDELRRLAGAAADEGAITAVDRELIERAFRFGDRRCDDIMVPRPEIVAVPITATVAEATEVALEAGHRRLVVYEGDIDHIVGIARVRDLVGVPPERQQIAVRNVVEQVLVAPESKRVADLLAEMQSSATHLAVIVDEYGGTAGVVTVEDIAEELLGTISEEGVDQAITPTGPGTWMIDGLLPVEDLQDVVGVKLPEGDWNTAGGLLMGLLGRLPRVGDQVDAGAASLRVVSVRGRRITRLEAKVAHPVP